MVITPSRSLLIDVDMFVCRYAAALVDSEAEQHRSQVTTLSEVLE